MSLSIINFSSHRPLVRFARSPKGILLAIFAVLAAVAVSTQDTNAAIANLCIGMATAALVDVAIVYGRHGKLAFPDGAILTGLIVSFILRVEEPWFAIVFAVVVAIAAKHALRTRWSNIFNPAAFALVVSSLVMHTGQSWWGALPDLGVLGVLLVLPAGFFISDRLNKLPMVFAFLGTYFTLFTLLSFFSGGLQAAEVFRTPDLQAVLFFALFMLDDPPTSPVHFEDQAVFGIITATVAFYLLEIHGVVYYLTAGVLVANAWESLRRTVVYQVRAFKSAHESRFCSTPRAT